MRSLFPTSWFSPLASLGFFSFSVFFFLFFNDTATTEIYTLSLHDALPIYGPDVANELIRAELYPYPEGLALVSKVGARRDLSGANLDRKSTRLNSSHL